MCIFRQQVLLKTMVHNLYYINQMHNNYKLDEQAITNIIKRHNKPIEKQKQIKLIYTRFKTSNFIVKNKTFF